jgi:hypothetical protein
MSEILAILSLINNLFPLIVQTIKTVESAFPQGGQGAAKLAVVQGVVEHALNVSTGLQVSAEKIIPVLSPIVSGVVSILNTTGVFNRTPTVPAVSTGAIDYKG